jgi:hypothetical protein
MKRIKFALKNVAILALLITSFIACDKDFATIGSDIVGQNNFDTDHIKYDVIAYNRKLNPVQTNGLPINLLGVYKDPLYGLTTATFVSQINSTVLDPDFGDNVVLDSVILTIPYFSRAIELTENGETLYELDSIYGDGFINLSIYESNYFLRNFDPNSEFDEPQRYYSNASTSNTNQISVSALEGQLIHQEPNLFKPSPNQINLEDEDGEITERLAPSLRLKLNKQFWQDKIINMEGEPELSNQNNFQNYFRGLYFKAEAVNGNGSMMLLNFASANANVTLYYTKDPFVEGNDREQTTYTLSFTGNRVNFLSNNFNFNIQDGNTTTGDEKLYLKGGEGSMAVINLFNGDADGNSTEFNTFKNQYVETDSDGHFVKAKRLVNEANLVFYVDQSLVNGQEPERVYLFDINNGIPLIDYYLDNTNTITINDSKANHLGKLQRVGGEPDGEGIRYKIRITEHINNILLKDSTNVKLGLVVCGNVNIENSAVQYNVLSSNNSDIIKKIPVSSTISPRGTVLYGNNTTNEQKKLYLEVFYTEPNN